MSLQSKVVGSVPVVVRGLVALCGWFFGKRGRCKAQLGNKVFDRPFPQTCGKVVGRGCERLWYVLCGSWGRGCVLPGKGCALFGLSRVLPGRGAVFAGFFSVGGGVGRSFCKTVAQIGWGNFANHLEFCIAVWYNDRERRWLFAKRHPLRGHC